MTTPTTVRPARIYSDNFETHLATIVDGSSGRFHIVVANKAVATFHSERDAISYLYGDEPDVDYCNHDVPGGCSDCRADWGTHAAIEAMNDQERSDYLYAGGTFETFFAPGGPAFLMGL